MPFLLLFPMVLRMPLLTVLNQTIFRGQSEIGKTWLFTTSVIVVASAGAETNILLHANPSNSRIIVRIGHALYGSTDGTRDVVFRAYLNPTLTDNGTLITSVCERLGGPAPTSQVFKSPSNDTTRGTLFGTDVARGGLTRDYDGGIHIPAGQNLLVSVETAHPSAGVFISSQFSEGEV